MTIAILVIACLNANANACIEIRSPTAFVSLTQCQMFAQMALPEVMLPHPKRRVARYSCQEVKTGEDI